MDNGQWLWPEGVALPDRSRLNFGALLFLPFLASFQTLFSRFSWHKCAFSYVSFPVFWFYTGSGIVSPHPLGGCLFLPPAITGGAVAGGSYLQSLQLLNETFISIHRILVYMFTVFLRIKNINTSKRGT